MIDWKSIRAAVFDLDGTLIDSARIWQEVDETFFARRGMAVPDGYAEEIAHLGFAESAALTVQRYFPRENAADIIEEWRELSLSRLHRAPGWGILGVSFRLRSEFSWGSTSPET